MSTSPGFAERVKLIWQTFRLWRKARPFWAGVFTLLSGLIIVAPPYASLQIGDMVVAMSTIGGVSALLIGTIMIICGVSMWIRKQFRFSAGVVTVLLALVALVTANLGSFLIGTILGLVGGGLAIAWTDRTPEPAAAAADDASGAEPTSEVDAPAPPTSAPQQRQASPRPRGENPGEPHSGTLPQPHDSSAQPDDSTAWWQPGALSVEQESSVARESSVEHDKSSVEHDGRAR